MSTHEDDQSLSKLYRQAKQQQPPVELDELIIQHASQSHHREKPGHNWRPWLTAASVLLVVPMIWMISREETILADSEPQTHFGQPVSEPLAIEEAADALPAESIADEWPATPPALTPAKPEPMAPLAADMASMDEQTDQPSRVQVTGNRLSNPSVSMNKMRLIEEATGGKKPLNPELMDPELALLFQQFERYLDEGQLDRAASILSDMQASHPAFDYSDLVRRLEQVRSNQPD